MDLTASPDHGLELFRNLNQFLTKSSVRASLSDVSEELENNCFLLFQCYEYFSGRSNINMISKSRISNKNIIYVFLVFNITNIQNTVSIIN